MLTMVEFGVHCSSGAIAALNQPSPFSPSPPPTPEEEEEEKRGERG